MAKKAVFLDRDGTIIKDKRYLHDPDQVEYFDDTFEAMRLMAEKGYHLFMVTNQSGIGRGYFQVEDMERVHQKIVADLARKDIIVEDTAYCPHSPEEGCQCRKPLPKMILDLIDKHGIDGKSYMIGDKSIDALAGIKAGVNGACLSSEKSADYPTYQSLLEFAKSLP